MLLFRKNWPAHRPWFIFSLILLGASSGWFVAARIQSAEWPGGSSLPGFSFGVAGGLIILFEFLLWLKKKKRIWRVGTAQSWLRAHIWLGLLCLPLLVYHSGFRLGGSLSTVLMLLLVVVVGSGVWGLWLQQKLPRRMLDEVPAETIYSQIARLAAQQAAEIEQLVQAVCGAEPQETQVLVGSAPRSARARQEPVPVSASSHLVVGAVRTVGSVQGKVVETWVPAAPIEDTEALLVFSRSVVLPYLRRGEKSDSILRFPNRAAVAFQELKTKLPPPAQPAVDRLQEACNQRRQWDEQARLHCWLHGWLWVHFPLSVALVVLMLVHAWVAVRYW